MLGAIAGDIIGSVYERRPIKTTQFPLFSPGCRFTDDTVLTIALADAILHDLDYGKTMREYYYRYRDRGYGGMFHLWANTEDSEPYFSFGNGAAMRISPVGHAYQTLEETLQKAEAYTAVTHNHPEGIKGAQATAMAIFLARTGSTKDDIREKIEGTFGYDLSKTLDAIRPGYRFDVTCQGSVPEAVTAFLESEDFEDAVRKAVSLGGDSDTLACITGGIAEAFYGGVPMPIQREVAKLLDEPLIEVVREFRRNFIPKQQVR